MRLGTLAAVALTAVAASACGDDQTGTSTVIENGDVTDTGGGAFTVTFAAPTEGLLVPADEPVAVKVTVAPAGAGYTISLAQDGNDLQSLRDIAVPASGTFETTVPLPSGAHTLAASVVSAAGKTASAEVHVVVNEAPVITGVELTPGTPGPNDNLEVTRVDATDPHTLGGAPLTFTYTWHRVGDTAILSTGDTLSASDTNPGDAFEVTVIAHDGLVDSAPFSKTIAIGNSAPSCSGVLLRPAAADTTQDVTCSCTGWSDADGDSDHSTCVFTDTNDGATLDSGGACTLPASETERGMTIACTLTPDDGTSQGSPLSSSSGQAVTILDAAPTAPTATIDPASGDAGTTFTCTLGTPSTDPDGDSVTYTVAWTVGGAATGATTTTLEPATVGASRGDKVCCALTATDGSASSAASTAACVTLANATPTMGTVLLSTTDGALPATHRSVLSCDAQDTADADGDALTMTYSWTVDGAPVAGASGQTLAASNLPLGARVACAATACDPEGACAPTATSKLSLVIANALPTLASVTITDADGKAHEDDTLTCTWSGWDDPDGDAAAVTYEWVVVDGDTGVETVLPGETDATLVLAGLTPGDTVRCRVTPMNGADAGPVKVSEPGVLVVVAPPVPPVVTLLAPSGADGDVTCQITTPAKYLPTGATTTFVWSTNGGAESAAPQVRTASEVSHCDLVRCRARVTGPDGLDITSATAALQMPLGGDCDDGNACTAAVCLQAGGCNSVPQDGVACDDGDPCSDQELCDNGECVGTVDVCSEDRLSRGATSDYRPFLAAGPDASYATTWFGTGNYEAWVRRTDADESRVATEVPLQPSGATGTILSEPTVMADGTVLTFRHSAVPNNPYNNLNQLAFTLYLQRWTPGMSAIGETAIATWYVTSSLSPGPWGAYGGGRIRALAFSDGTVGAVDATRNQFRWTGIHYHLVGVDQALGGDVTLVAASATYHPGTWDAAIVPDGTDDFVLSYADAGNQTVMVQRFTKDGAPVWTNAVTVAAQGAAIDLTRVAAFPNGRFVVAWQADAADGAGKGIRAQRLDDQGNFVGSAFTMNAATASDQVLGDVGAFSDYRFVVAYRDASTPTAKYLARTFSSGAVGDTPIVVNETTAVSVSAPALAVLSNDAFVVAWRDSANVLWTRRYAGSGAPDAASGEFRANDEVTNAQESPAAAGATGGNVLVAYATKVFAGAAATEIGARVFDPDGLEVAPELLVNDEHYDGAQTTPAVAAGVDDFVVAWNSDGQDGDVDGVFARRYDEMGAATSGAFAVNTTTTGYQRQPAVAEAADGTTVFAWNAQADAASSCDIVMRVFAADGTGGAEKVVNAPTAGPQDHPTVAIVPFAPQAVVAWQSKSQDGSGYGIYARKVGFDGSAIGAEIQLNTTTAGDQRAPSITAIQTGFFVVCWESVGQGAGGKIAVVCQRVKTSTMVPQGGELVPLASDDDQTAPVARYLASGRLAVAWSGLSLDQEGQGIQLARVNDLAQAVAPPIVANRYGKSDQYRPFLVAQDDRLFVGWQSNGQAGPAGEGDVYFRILPMTP